MRAMERAPTLLSWSGGKDCLLALEHLRRAPGAEVVALVTLMDAGRDRNSAHGIRRRVLAAQAAALGLPLLTVELPGAVDNATWLRHWNAALTRARARWPGLASVAFGDLLLADVRAWREAHLAARGWQARFPLWGADTAALARAFIAAGHRARLVCVDTTRLDAGFCGRAFDREFLAALPARVDPCGENGEFHTLVWGGPLFRRDLTLHAGESRLRDGRFQKQDFSLAAAPGRRA